MVISPDSPCRVLFEHVPIEEFSKKQLHPDDTNMSSVVKTGVVIDPGQTSNLMNVKDPADFDEQANKLFDAQKIASSETNE